MELDIYDKKILAFLRKDSQMTLKDMEDKIKLKISTIHNRIKKLEQNGIINGYMAVIDYNAIDFPLVAHIMVSFEKSENTPDQLIVAENISKFEWVEEVHIIAGEFDILLKVRAKHIEDLGIFVTKELKEVNGVGGTRTLVSLSNVKQYYNEPFITDLVAK